MNFREKHLLRSKVFLTVIENKKLNIFLSMTSFLGFYVLYLLIKEIGLNFSSEQILNFPILFSLVFVFGSFCLRAVRYNLLSSPFGNLTFKASLITVTKGYTLNCIIPLRAGEIYRIFRGKLDLDCSYPESLAIISIEKGIDIAVYSLLSLPILFILEHFFDPSEYFWIAIVLVCLLLLMVFATLISLSLKKFLFLLLSHLYLISKNIPKSTLLTLCIFALEMVAFWLVARVFEIELSLFQTVLIVGISNISTLFLPSPAGIGAFEYSIVFVLGNFFNSPIQDALAFAFVTHAILIIPISIMGLIMFLFSVRLNSMSRLEKK